MLIFWSGGRISLQFPPCSYLVFNLRFIADFIFYISNLMSYSLKKHGLSETLHELKFQISSQGSRISQKHQSNRSRRTQPVSMISNFQLLPEEEPKRNPLVLDVLIDLISIREREACLFKQHDYNPTKYICLEKTCSSKLGCSYCFLSNHHTHSKIEAHLCLKDLLELQQKVSHNRAQIKQELQNRKSRVKQRIQKELQKIKQDFINNLDYLNTKIWDILDSQFNNRMAAFQNFPPTHPTPHHNQQHSHQHQQQHQHHQHQQQQQHSEKHAQKGVYSEQKNQKFSEFQQILLAFNSKPSNDIFLASHLQKNTSRVKPNHSKKQQFSVYDIPKDEELALLSKLPKINFSEVQQFLKAQLLRARQFGQFVDTFDEYYSELGASLSEFFGSFKRAVPTLPTVQNKMQEPEILKLFSF